VEQARHRQDPGLGPDRSTFADEGECRRGLLGSLELFDTRSTLENGKTGDHVLLGNWRGKCPSFVMGWTNADGGPRTDPRSGGLPGGGEWATVELRSR
jgi:hypothetical protein